MKISAVSLIAWSTALAVAKTLNLGQLNEVINPLVDSITRNPRRQYLAGDGSNHRTVLHLPPLHCCGHLVHGDRPPDRPA